MLGLPTITRDGPRVMVPRTMAEARAEHSQPNHIKIGRLDYVIDGDSFWAWIDLDFDEIYARRNCRLLGIDAPDKQPGKGESGRWLADHMRETVYLYIPGIDKYGRPLVAVYTDTHGPSLNDLSLAAGMSVPYDGGPRV